MTVFFNQNLLLPRLGLALIPKGVLSKKVVEAKLNKAIAVAEKLLEKVKDQNSKKTLRTILSMLRFYKSNFRFYKKELDLLNKKIGREIELIKGVYKAYKKGEVYQPSTSIHTITYRKKDKPILSLNSSPDLHYVVDLDRQSGEKQLHALSMAAKKEEAWIYVEYSIRGRTYKKWFECGTDETGRMVKIDLSMIPVLLKLRVKISYLSVYHIHPKQCSCKTIPSAVDIYSFAKAAVHIRGGLKYWGPLNFPIISPQGKFVLTYNLKDIKNFAGRVADSVTDSALMVARKEVKSPQYFARQISNPALKAEFFPRQAAAERSLKAEIEKAIKVAAKLKDKVKDEASKRKLTNLKLRLNGYLNKISGSKDINLLSFIDIRLKEEIEIIKSIYKSYKKRKTEKKEAPTAGLKSMPNLGENADGAVDRTLDRVRDSKVREHEERMKAAERKKEDPLARFNAQLVKTVSKEVKTQMDRFFTNSNKILEKAPLIIYGTVVKDTKSFRISRVYMTKAFKKAAKVSSNALSSFEIILQKTFVKLPEKAPHTLRKVKITIEK